MHKKLVDEILEANIREHIKEAKYYDLIHTEIFNLSEQKRIQGRLHEITNEYSKNIKILEIGAGTGNVTLKLLDMGFKNITCVDISKDMLNILRKKLSDYKIDINLVVSDIDSYLNNNSKKSDLIIMSSVLHHLPDYIKTLRTMRKNLSNNGKIYATHEPMPPSGLNKVVKIILKIDYLFYMLRYIINILRGDLKYLKRDCTMSDYHTHERAISLNKISDKLKYFYSVRVRTFPVAKFSLTTNLLWKLKYRNNFEILLKKDFILKVLKNDK